MLTRGINRAVNKNIYNAKSIIQCVQCTPMRMSKFSRETDLAKHDDTVTQGHWLFWDQQKFFRKDISTKNLTINFLKPAINNKIMTRNNKYQKTANTPRKRNISKNAIFLV